MRPTLPSDVLLLAVGERAGYLTRGPVETVLAGALLCADVLSGAALPAPGPAQAAALRRQLDERAASALDEASRPLCAAQVLSPHEHRVLGLFRRSGFAVLDAGARADAERRLRSALTPGSSPDAGAAALAVLCAVSGIARRIVPPPTSPADREAVADHLNGLAVVLGADLSAVLEATRARYHREAGGEGAFVPVGSGDCYGDGSGGHGGGDGGSDGGGGDGGGGGD